MKTLRRVVATLLVAVMAATVFSTMAMAADRKSAGDKAVAKAQKQLLAIDNERFYTGDVDDPILIYYASQPFTQPFTFLKWYLDHNKQQKPDYEGHLKDIGYGVVSDLGGYYAKNYLSKTLETLNDASSDIADGLKTGPDKLVKKVAKKVPIVSDLYTISGPAGKMTLQAILLPGYLATNAGALAFVLVGGGVALAVIFGLSGILSPFLALREGPQTIDQFFRDIHEMEVAVDAAK